MVGLHEGVRLRPRNLFLTTRLKRGALGMQGAQLATREPRRANLAAQLHQGLVERPAIVGGQQVLGKLPQQFLSGGRRRFISKGEQPAIEPDGVGLENWSTLIEGDRHNRSGGIAPDAGQCEQRRQRAGKFAAMFESNHLCRAMHLTCPAIVAQAFPMSEHGVLVGGSQRLYIRKGS